MQVLSLGVMPTLYSPTYGSYSVGRRRAGAKSRGTRGVPTALPSSCALAIASYASRAAAETGGVTGWIDEGFALASLPEADDGRADSAAAPEPA